MRQALAQWRLLQIIDLLTPWEIVLVEKLTGSKLVKKFPALYVT